MLRKSKTIFVTIVPFRNAVIAINCNKPTHNLLGDTVYFQRNILICPCISEPPPQSLRGSRLRISPKSLIDSNTEQDTRHCRNSDSVVIGRKSEINNCLWQWNLVNTAVTQQRKHIVVHFLNVQFFFLTFLAKSSIFPRVFFSSSSFMCHIPDIKFKLPEKSYLEQFREVNGFGWGWGWFWVRQRQADPTGKIGKTLSILFR